MSNVAKSAQAGRYQTVHRHVGGSTNLTSGTGTIMTFQVTHPKIELLTAGFHHTADTGAVSTPPVFEVRRRARAGGTATIINAAATVSLPAGRVGPNTVERDLDFAAPDPSDPLGVQKYKEVRILAYRGDEIIFHQGTQGSGGTQVGLPFLEYRARP